MEKPTISIIIPTCNRPEPLTCCLRSISQLDFPRERFEIIIVDDGSTQPLDPIINKYQNRLDITLLVQENAGPAAARNSGAEIAKGRYLAFTDDDCKPNPDWLKIIDARFDQEPETLIGGQTINALDDNLYLTASQLLIDYLYSHYTLNGNKPRFFTSNNMALPAAGFKAMGGFDSRFRRAGGEDREFCDRWQYHGFSMVYEPKAIIKHAHRLTFRTYWRQHWNYGKGAYIFQQVHAKRDQDRIRLEPLSFYIKLLQFPFKDSINLRSLNLSGLLLVSQIANAAGFFQERLRISSRT